MMYQYVGNIYTKRIIEPCKEIYDRREMRERYYAEKLLSNAQRYIYVCLDTCAHEILLLLLLYDKIKNRE